MNGRTILVVDDDEILVEVLTKYLSENLTGALVVGLTESSQALEFVQSTPVDVLISDLWMPGMTGDELLSVARLVQPKTRRILMTANPEPEALMQATNKGGLEYCFQKPVDPPEIGRVIEAMMATF